MNRALDAGGGPSPHSPRYRHRDGAPYKLPRAHLLHRANPQAPHDRELSVINEIIMPCLTAGPQLPAPPHGVSLSADPGSGRLPRGGAGVCRDKGQERAEGHRTWARHGLRGGHQRRNPRPRPPSEQSAREARTWRTPPARDLASLPRARQGAAPVTPVLQTGSLRTGGSPDCPRVAGRVLAPDPGRQAGVHRPRGGRLCPPAETTRLLRTGDGR